MGGGGGGRRRCLRLTLYAIPPVEAEVLASHHVVVDVPQLILAEQLALPVLRGRGVLPEVERRACELVSEIRCPGMDSLTIGTYPVLSINSSCYRGVGAWRLDASKHTHLIE